MWPFTPSKSYEKAQRDAAQASKTESNQCLEKPSVIPPVTGFIDSRLSIPFLPRFPLTIVLALFSGFFLGAAKGGARAAYRYRAENAHRLPTSQTGWYLYHKSKNYHKFLGGAKEGLRFGGRLSGWGALFVCSEELVDQLRGGGDDRQRDAAGTVCAGMTTAGIYSWKNGSDIFTSARLARTALKASLTYGLFQDLMSTVRGRRPAYIDWVLRHVLGQRDKVEI